MTTQSESQKNSFLTPKKVLLTMFGMGATAVAALVVGVAVTLNPTKQAIEPEVQPKVHTVEILSPTGAPSTVVEASASQLAQVSVDVSATEPNAKVEASASQLAQASEAESTGVATAATAAVAAATVAAVSNKKVDAPEKKALKTEAREPNSRKATGTADNTIIAKAKTDTNKKQEKPLETAKAKNDSKASDKDKTKEKELAKAKQDKAKNTETAQAKPADKTKTASNNIKETPLEPTNRRATNTNTTIAAKSAPRPKAEAPAAPKPARQQAQQSKDIMDNLF